MILKAIEYEANHMCPYKQVKIFVNTPEWMNRELLEYQLERDILFRVHRRKKTQNSYDRVASARRMYNRLVKEAKQNFMLGKLKQHNKDQNKFWNEIKKLIPKMNNREVRGNKPNDR